MLVAVIDPAEIDAGTVIAYLPLLASLNVTVSPVANAEVPGFQFNCVVSQVTPSPIPPLFHVTTAALADVMCPKNNPIATRTLSATMIKRGRAITNLPEGKC